MDRFSSELNALLSDTFNKILKLEEESIKRNNKAGLSMSELHLIEVVGKGKEVPKTISMIAVDLGITLSSVTIAVNKLVKRGFLVKQKNSEDGRSVYISLTLSGEKMFRYHSLFHEKMVRSITEHLSLDEQKTLIACVEKLNLLFSKNPEVVQGVE